jgi:hypothetical protein
MSRLPVAGRPLACESPGLRLLKSMASRATSAVSDADLIIVLIVLTAVCLLALNVDVVAPDAMLAMRQFGPYP